MGWGGIEPPTTASRTAPSFFFIKRKNALGSKKEKQPIAMQLASYGIFKENS